MTGRNPSLLAALSFIETEQDAADNIPAIVTCLENNYTAFGWRRALLEMNITIETVNGNMRRDGTPAILHELSQQIYTLGLIDAGLLDVNDPNAERISCLNAAHDRCEDIYEPPVDAKTYAALRQAYVQWHTHIVARRMGRSYPDREDVAIAILTWNMSKTCGDTKLYASAEEQHARMLWHPASGIAKLCDRAHNNATLIAGSGHNQLLANLKETRTIYGRYTKSGAILFPRYKPVFDFFNGFIARQVRVTEGVLGILDDKTPLSEKFDNAANNFTIPHGLNPMEMIKARAGRQAQGDEYPPSAWHHALEPGTELR